MIHLALRVHDIATDGLPPREIPLNRLAFAFRGNLLRGWPMLPEQHPGLYSDFACEVLWHITEPVTNAIGQHQVFAGVTHWAEIPPELDAILKAPAPVAPPGHAAALPTTRTPHAAPHSIH